MVTLSSKMNENQMVATAPQVAGFLRIGYPTLQYWLSKGALGPALQSPGTGNPRVFNRQDAVTCRIVQEVLRNNGDISMAGMAAWAESNENVLVMFSK